ncbi:flagellar L-ring protein 1 [Agaricicola taiwanensis]|uniref:Flagellar L-ring protein n=1 Tax=Agaricicola taiwanensis TaxID=591372 RepID=A0A8J2VSK7_9RHOB|nr:flagellar basal body L-ring protein FlgH [Agaricicola taiwanensis]GGE40592.1 flagellar L-ring protein 1 [Agaricicola taiwanensis]
MTPYSLSRACLSAGLALLVANCGAADRLKQVGQPPALAAIEDPTAQPGYRPVRMPMPDPEVATYQANSLWQTGSRGFFKDQRAQKVGDILTVKVQVSDRAEFENETERTRTNSEGLGLNNLFGYEQALNKVLPEAVDNENLVRAGSTSSSSGAGSVERSERLVTNVAAVVTQILPNGNLVVEGRQEIRVNFEIRELIVAGIVRPEDIDSSNQIDSTKIAEARIAYGGRGQITDVQQPRYGQQVLDILLPF